MSTVAAGSTDPRVQYLPCCAFCSRRVILPPNVYPAQFIICTICDRKMVSANAITQPRAQPAAMLGVSMDNPIQYVPQLPGQPKPTITIKPRKSATTQQSRKPLVIKIPAVPESAPRTRRPHQPTIPGQEKSSSKLKVPPKRKTSQQMDTRVSSSKGELPQLLTQWAEAERAIATLSTRPHFNDKGEYLTVSPSIPSSFGSDKMMSTSSPIARTSPFVGSMPYSASQQFPLAGSVGEYALQSPSPLVGTPTSSASVSSARSSLPPTTPKDGEMSSVSARPRLTLRLPSRPPLNKQEIPPPLSAPLPSASRTSQSVSSPTTRPCKQLNCKSVLPPSHPWIFCAGCLQNPAPKTLSPSDDPHAMPQISKTRRISEPTVSLTEEQSASADHSRRKSEPLMPPPADVKKPTIRIPQLFKSLPAVKQESPEEKARVIETNDKCVLPTPPPSSRQSSPVPPPESSSVHSSPEMPLASLHSPNAPRYRPRDEDEDNVWDSDLSELTPLESSDEEGNGRHREDGRTGRERTSNTFEKSQSFVCVRTKCHNLLVPWTKWKMCHTCRVKFRQRSRERNNSKFALATDGGAEGDVAGSDRKCAIKTCKTNLPSISVYRWKLCEPCRTRSRRQSRKRRYGDVGLASDEDGEELPEPMARRRSSAVNFKKLKLTFKGETVANVEARKPAPPSVVIPDNTVRYPLYQTPDLLLEALQNRLLGFVTGTTQYLLFKLVRNTPLESVQATVFAFEGEFSVISDPAGGEVGTKIQIIQAEIAKALGMQFALSGYQVEPTGTIIGQYTCTHNIIIPLPVKPETQSSSSESATDSVATALPAAPVPEDPLDELVNIPSDDTANAQEPPAKTPSEEPSPAQDASSSPTSTNDKPTAEPNASPKLEPSIKPDPDAATPTLPSEPLKISVSDVTPKASPIDATANFGVVVKPMAGELKISLLWDRSHRYFPGLRTIVQFQLVG